MARYKPGCVRTRRLILSVKKQSRGGMKRAILLAAILAAIGSLLACGESYVEKKYADEILTMAVSEVQNRTVTEASRLVSEAVDEAHLTYGDVLHFEKRGDGTIIACRTDTALLNKLGAGITEGMDRYFRKEGGDVGIPLGNLIGPGTFYARGPRVQFRVLPAGRISCDYESVFYAAGINQTIHRISFRISVSVTVIGAGGRETVDIMGTFPVAEAVLVGSIPDYYAEGHGE